MHSNLHAFAAVGLLAGIVAAAPTSAQKTGGILQMPGFASPASMSIHEESTIAAGIPLMGVFNNLVLFDQHVAQNSLASIVPDLASDWSWDETGVALIRASNGTTASPSPPPMSNAPGTHWPARRARNSGSIPASPGTAISTRSRPMATGRSPFT